MVNPAPTEASFDDALTQLVDEAGVRDATARFADAATRGDVAAFRSMWTDDGEFTIGTRVHAVGPDDIEETFRRLREGREFFVQFAVQGPIRVTGDDATTSCLIHEAARGPGESYYRNHCLSTDRLRRNGTQWLFSGRIFHYLWLDTTPFSGDSVALPAA